MTSLETPELSVQGGVFVRYLIRRFGIDAFLRYYEQSPERRDPALFAANFLSFWGTTVDDVWSDIHDHPVTEVFIGDAKICPCSLPPVRPPGRSRTTSRARRTGRCRRSAGETLALTAAWAERVVVQDCAGIREPMTGQGVLARLDDTVAPRFVLAPLESATVGPYLSDDCAATAPYTITTAFKSRAGLDLEITRPATGVAPLYLELTTTMPLTAAATAIPYAICDTCGFDPGACPPAATMTSWQTAPGTFYGRTTLYTSYPPPYADVIGAHVDIRP